MMASPHTVATMLPCEFMKKAETEDAVMIGM
jgi:hypothetical protein